MENGGANQLQAFLFLQDWSSSVQHSSIFSTSQECFFLVLLHALNKLLPERTTAIPPGRIQFLSRQKTTKKQQPDTSQKPRKFSGIQISVFRKPLECHSTGNSSYLIASFSRWHLSLQISNSHIFYILFFQSYERSSADIAYCLLVLMLCSSSATDSDCGWGMGVALVVAFLMVCLYGHVDVV